MENLFENDIEMFSHFFSSYMLLSTHKCKYERNIVKIEYITSTYGIVGGTSHCRFTEFS